MSRPAIDLDACARTLVARIAARQEAARSRGDALRRQAREAVRALASDFGIRRAWLFGSLAWGEPHADSDVDLLVEGLEPTLAARAEKRVAEMVQAPVDLVRIEDAPPGLAERVKRDGLLLHEPA